MAEQVRQRSPGQGSQGSTLTAFFAALLIIAAIGYAVWAYTGGAQRQLAGANFNVGAPELAPPMTDVPDPPPAPTLPPS